MINFASLVYNPNAINAESSINYVLLIYCGDCPITIIVKELLCTSCNSTTDRIILQLLNKFVCVLCHMIVHGLFKEDSLKLATESDTTFIHHRVGRLYK